MSADRYDVIIIGSGAGGGTLAHRLAPSGKRILILERGDYLPRERENWSSEAVFAGERYKAHETWHDKDGKPLPGVAQVAMQGGAYAAKVIRARVAKKTGPPPFHYFNKGDLAVIGRAAAVANIFGFHLSGLAAWLVWLFIHLIYIVEFQSRVLVFVQWGFQYLTFSRGARLITGEDVTPPRAP